MQPNFKIPTLLQGEKVIYESAPDINLKRYYVWSSVLGFGTMIGFFFIMFMLSIIATIFDGDIGGFFALLFILFILLIIGIGVVFICIWGSEKAYSQRYYWITTKRIIYRRGFLGYSISSLPYERIADVILTRGWLESLFGFGSLQIQTLAGQISRGAAGSEGHLQAIPDPEKVQTIILKAMKGNFDL